MGFLSSMANAADTATGGALSGLGINIPFDQNFKQDNKSGSAPSLASGAYKKWIYKKGLGNKIWFTEAADWAKVFGYRFSIAYINPEAPIGVGGIEEKLSALNNGFDQGGLAVSVIDKLTGGAASSVFGAVKVVTAEVGSEMEIGFPSTWVQRYETIPSSESVEADPSNVTKVPSVASI